MAKIRETHEHTCTICAKTFTNFRISSLTCSKKCSKKRIKERSHDGFKRWYAIPENHAKTVKKNNQWYRENKEYFLAMRKEKIKKNNENKKRKV